MFHVEIEKGRMLNELFSAFSKKCKSKPGVGGSYKGLSRKLERKPHVTNVLLAKTNGVIYDIHKKA